MSANFDFSVNYECTSATDHFFRLTHTPLSAIITPIGPASTYWYTVNNSPKQKITDAYTFDTSTSAIYTITVFCTSDSAPQIQQKSISAIILDSLPLADFVSWPMYYIPDSTRIIKLSASNYYLSQSVSFYGEGHTDCIQFSAASAAAVNISSGCNYTWTVNGSTTTSTSLSTAYITIGTVANVSALLPVECLVTNNSQYIKNNSPKYYYDDKTGEMNSYSYYYNTHNNVNNNTYKQDVHIKTYPVPTNKLSHDVSFPLILGSGESIACNFIFDFSPYNNYLDDCYGKYGDVWKWSTFVEKYSSIPGTWSSLAPQPNPNATKQLYFPKKWHVEPEESVDFIRTPITTTLSTIRWYVDTDYWSYRFPAKENNFNIVPASSLQSFTFPLTSYSNSLTSLYVVNSLANTRLLISVQATFLYKMNDFSGVVNDWQPRLQTLWHDVSTYTYPLPSVALYSPTKYVLRTQ